MQLVIIILMNEDYEKYMKFRTSSIDNYQVKAKVKPFVVDRFFFFITKVTQDIDHKFRVTA